MYSSAPAFDFIGQVLDQVRARQRIDRIGHARFVGDDLLGAQRHPHRFLGRQPQGLVHASWCAATLRPAEDGGQRLQRDAHDVVLRLLGGQRGAGRLRVEAQRPGLSGSAPEALAHDLRPQTPRRAELGDFFQQVVVRVEEERQLRGEIVHIQAGVRAQPARRRCRWPA